MSLSDQSNLVPDDARRMAARFLREALQDLVAAFNMDMFARLSLLEGAAGVSPGTWLRRGARGFGEALEHFGPRLAPQWTTSQNQGVYDKALSVAERTLSGTGVDAPDLIQDMTINSTRSGGNDRTRLFYTVGSKLRSFEHDLGEGKITPRDGKVLGTIDRWVTRAAITELKSWRSRKVRHFAPGTEEGFDPTRVRSAPGLDSESREKLILLALQSPGGPGNEIRRIVDRLIDQSFAPSARPIVRVFLQKISEPKYRSPAQMRQIVKRFTPEKWFSQAMTVIRNEMMRELGISSQQLTNALGGKASKVFKFMRERVGQDSRVQKILTQLADDIDLLEPGVTRLSKDKRHQLTEEQTPEQPWTSVVEWVREDEEDKDQKEADHLPKQHGRPDHWLDLYESGEYMDWSSLVGPHGVFNRGPTPLKVAERFLRAKVEKTLSEEETKKYLATPPDERVQDVIHDTKGNTFSGGVVVNGKPIIRKSKIEGKAQIGNNAFVENSEVGDNAVVEGDARVTDSKILGYARLRGTTQVHNVKIIGGSWEDQKIKDGHGGTFHDAYAQEVLDVLTAIKGTSPGPGDSPLQAMARYFADGGRTKGWFGISGQLDRHSLQEKIQKHVYEKYDEKKPWLGRGAAALEKLDDDGFKKLLEVAKNKGAHLKDERKNKEAHQRNRRFTYALTEAAFLHPELRDDLVPLVQLAHTSRVAAAGMDLRGVAVRVAFATKKAAVRNAIVGALKQADALDKTALRGQKKRYRQPFLRWIANRRFPHPEPGHKKDVSFFTLPSSEQSRIYNEWQKDYRDWARQHMPKGLGDSTRITTDNFDDVEVGDVLWYSASPGKLLRVTGINREGWRARQPTLELVQIDPQNPEWEGEQRNINKSTLRNDFLEVHRLPGHGPGAKRERERLRQQESERRRKEHRERVRAELPREPKGGWPEFDDVGLSEKKRKTVQEAFKAMGEIQDLDEVKLSRIFRRLNKALGEKPSRKVMKEFMHALGEWADQLGDTAQKGGQDFEPEQRRFALIRAKIDQGIRNLDRMDRQDRRDKREEKQREKEQQQESDRSKRVEKHQDRKKLRGGGQKKLEDEAHLTSWFISQVLPENAPKAVKDKAREQLKKAKYGDLEAMLAAADHIVEKPDSDFAKNHALVKHLGWDREGLIRLRKLLRRKLKDVHGRTYHPDVLRIANQYGLETEDADALYDWRADKPPRGRPLSDQEKFNRFMAKAKPETRERMQGMALADFMVMYKAILQEVLDDEEEMAA